MTNAELLQTLRLAQAKLQLLTALLETERLTNSDALLLELLQHDRCLEVCTELAEWYAQTADDPSGSAEPATPLANPSPPLLELGLSRRAVGFLFRRLKCVTVDDLAAKSAAELRAERGCGHGLVAEIRERLERVGRHLRDDVLMVDWPPASPQDLETARNVELRTFSDWPQAVVASLQLHGVRTLRDVTGLTLLELESLPAIGTSSTFLITRALRRVGLYLKGETWPSSPPTP